MGRAPPPMPSTQRPKHLQIKGLHTTAPPPMRPRRRGPEGPEGFSTLHLALSFFSTCTQVCTILPYPPCGCWRGTRLAPSTRPVALDTRDAYAVRAGAPLTPSAAHLDQSALRGNPAHHPIPSCTKGRVREGPSRSEAAPRAAGSRLTGAQQTPRLKARRLRPALRSRYYRILCDAVKRKNAKT